LAIGSGPIFNIIDSGEVKRKSASGIEDLYGPDRDRKDGWFDGWVVEYGFPFLRVDREVLGHLDRDFC
jgi:hypothetical protein